VPVERFSQFASRASSSQPPFCLSLPLTQGGEEARRHRLLGEVQGRADGGLAQEDPREFGFVAAANTHNTACEAVRNSRGVIMFLTTKRPINIWFTQEQLEMKKAARAERLKNAAATVRKEAQEKRAAAEARRGEEAVRAEEAAARYHDRGQAPTATRIFGVRLLGRG
jgi:hypothetical protein